MLSFPVQGEGSHGAEGTGGEADGGEDDEVDVVAQVDPDEDEEAEIWHCDGGVDVVESFGGLEGVRMEILLEISQVDGRCEEEDSIEGKEKVGRSLPLKRNR